MFSVPEGRAAPCPLHLWSEVRDEPHTVSAGCWGQVRSLVCSPLGAWAPGRRDCCGLRQSRMPWGIAPGRLRQGTPRLAGDLYEGEAGPRPPGTGAAIPPGSAGPASVLFLPRICGPLPTSSLHRPHPWAVSSLPGGLPSSARKSPGAACPLRGSKVPPAPRDGGCPREGARPKERSIWMNVLPSSPLLVGKGETPARRKKPWSERSTRSQLVVTLRVVSSSC